MSKFNKTLRILFSLLIIIATAFFFILLEGVEAFGYRIETIENYFREFAATEYGFYTISIMCGLIILGSLILVLSTVARPTSKSNLTLVDEGGKVELTDDAIEAYVYKSLQNFPQLRNSEVNCTILDGSNKRINAKIKSTVYNTTDLTTLAAEIKDKTKSDIDLFIGKPIADVNVVLGKPVERSSNNSVSHEAGSHYMSIE
ncbi:alkaline shock response membrane anchor protein AmaP [Eubacteriales bacterium KG127]